MDGCPCTGGASHTTRNGGAALELPESKKPPPLSNASTTRNGGAALELPEYGKQEILVSTAKVARNGGAALELPESP